MVLNAIGPLSENRNPLELTELPVPAPGAEDLLVELKERKIRGAKVLRTG
jgi:hypothetical protein